MVHRDERRPDRIYWRCLQHKKDGHAVYPTIDAADFKPGVCGYFDRDGDWKLVVDLATPAEQLRLDGYTALSKDQDMSFVNPNSGVEEFWGPRISHDVERIEVVGEMSAQHQGAGGAASVRYRSSSDEAAVLLTRGPISRCHTGVKDQVFLDWMRDNAAKIIQENPEAKDWGLWIVTKTCSATRRAFSVVESRGTEFSWSISAEAAGVAQLSPTATWWSSHDASEWTMSYNAKGVILFMCGIKWIPKRIQWKSNALKPILEKDKQKHLGRGQNIPIVEVVEGTDECGELTQFEAHSFPSR